MPEVAVSYMGGERLNYFLLVEYITGDGTRSKVHVGVLNPDMGTRSIDLPYIIRYRG